MSISIELKGLKLIKHTFELKRDSNELSLELRKCANVVKDEISKVVPIDTGELRRSLSIIKINKTQYIVV